MDAHISAYSFFFSLSPLFHKHISITTTQTIRPNGLTYEIVPLPPLPPPAKEEEENGGTVASSFSYSKFVSTVPTISFSTSKFEYGPNYDTHVPNRNVVAYVGGGGGGGGNDAVTGAIGGGGRYVLNLPHVYGTVVGYSPPPSSFSSSLAGGKKVKCEYDHDDDEGEGGGEFPIERLREDTALFRVLWDGHATSSGVGYVEDLTYPELASCLLGKKNAKNDNMDDESRLPPPSSSSRKNERRRGLGAGRKEEVENGGGKKTMSMSMKSETAHAIARHVHATTARRQLALEWKVECSILPRLVVVAALELRREVARRVRSEILLERLRSSSSRMTKNADDEREGKGRGGDSINPDGADFGYYARHPNQYMPGFVPPPPPPHDDDDDDDADDDDDVDDDANDTDDDEGRRKRQSKTRLTPPELDRYRAKVEAEMNLPPSKIAERVRIACTAAYEHVASRGSMDEYYAECDARKERERLESIASGRGGGGRGGTTMTGEVEVRRSSRARAVVNYAEDGASASAAWGGILNGRDGIAAGKAGGGGALPRENACGGPTALHLLGLLGMLPDEKKKEDGDFGSGKGDAESEKVDDDPFFEPNPCLIIDQLGRKHRYLSPASVQSAIVRGIEDQIDTPECLLDEEESLEISRQRRQKSSHHYVTDLTCTTGDKVADLGEYEPASFARCRFAPRTFLPESDEEEEEEEEYSAATPEEIEARHRAIEERQRRREQRRMERRAAYQKRSADLERAYRSQKSFELWRFRCIHGDGCTVFPLWRDVSRELIRNIIAPGGVEAGGGAVAFNGGEQVALADAPTVTSSSEAFLAPVVAADVTQNDEELARSLAAAAALEAIDEDTGLAKRRRTARRAVAASAGEPVFYGGNTSMSRDQLCDTLVRLLHQAGRCDLGGSSSLMSLKRIIFPENYDSSRGGLVEMRKLRSALGHLVYKLGKVRRLIVNVKGSDSICWELLRDNPLVKFVGNDSGDMAVAATNISQIKGEPSGDDTEMGKPAAADDVAKIDANGVANDPLSIVGSASTSSNVAQAMDPHLKSQLESLEIYVSNLHRTELSLRNSLMKAIDKGNGTSDGNGTLLQISTLAIATASDEVDRSADAEDWKYFSNVKAAEKSNDNGDTTFGSPDKVEWHSNADRHALIGQVMYRPQFSPLRPSQEEDATAGNGDAQFMNEKCYWYKIVSYTPSIKIVEDVASESGIPSSTGVAAVESARPRDNMIVERRMRFRAVPVAESDIAAEESAAAGMDTDEDEDEDIEYMILTEGQARAGVEAAMLHRKMSKAKGDIGTTAKSQSNQNDDAPHQVVSAGPHPYRNRYGSRVMLIPQPTNGEEEANDRAKFQILYGIIAGYDIVHKKSDNDVGGNSVVTNKILVLLNGGDENIVKDDMVDSENNVGAEEKSPGVAFWSTVVDNSDGTTSLTDLSPTFPPEEGNVLSNSNGTTTTSPTSSILCSIYNIEMHEFCEGSEAYKACSSIITYLKNQSKIGPFLQPVNYVDMGLFDYPTVVKTPMDVSTLEKNLADGKYSRISPSKQAEENADDMDDDGGTDHPVYRMIYGEFHDALMLIFDNCIKYNGETSWIGGEAAIVKKNVIKKIQQVVSKAVWQGQGQGEGGRNTSNVKSSSGRMPRGGAGAGKKSMYVDEDSDVDMYMYESEDDEEYDGAGAGKRRSRKGRGGGGSVKPKSSAKNKRGREDIPSMAIEQPFMVPETAQEFVSGGAFPHIKIQTNVGKFAMSQELWSCRYLKEEDPKEIANGGGEGDIASKKEAAEDEEMLLLMQLQHQEDESGRIRRSTRERHAPQNYADEVGESSYVFADSSSTHQSPVTLPGVEYYLINDEFFRSRKGPLKDEECECNTSYNDTADSLTIPTVCRSRLGAEGIQETIHECFYAKLYRDQSPNALILEGGLGKYADGSFPPYLGRVLPSSSSSSSSGGERGDGAIVWEIREQYLMPALRWVLRGLVRSGHLEEVDRSLSEGVLDDAQSRTYFGAGTVTPSHEYYYDQSFSPFDVLDEKEISRKRRQTAGAVDGDKVKNEEKVELSEYEQMRAERVARNAERLKALGLA